MKLPAAILAVILCSAAVWADDVRPPQFVEVPGNQEFSGELMARPVQPVQWVRRGEENAGARVAAARAAMAAFEIVEYRPHTDLYVFKVPEGRTENEVAAALLATGNFQYVHPNWVVYPADNCPNDPLLGEQWHHDASKLNSCEGWTVHTGDPSIVVGICDTGIDVSHEDFREHRYEGYNAVDRLWESQGGDISAVHSHGTEVTGLAAANGNNGRGIAGVGWNLGHRMIRVSNSSGGGSTIATLTHGAETSIEAGDKVANVSYTGVNNEAVRTSATYIKSIGGLLVWAADNSNTNHASHHRDEDDLIVVAATTINDVKAGFSSYGLYVDLAAPGADVFTARPGSGYGTNSGTSFAAPLVAGLIGLIWSVDPNLEPDEVERILKEGCDDIGNEHLGYGRINVYNSLVLAPTAILFEYPQGLPEVAPPGEGARLRVLVKPRDTDPRPGTGMLHYDTGSGFVAVPMVEVEPNLYEAQLPPLDCGQELEFYVSAETMGGERITNPSNAPDRVHPLLTGRITYSTILEEDFRGGLPTGWGATGLWNITELCSVGASCVGGPYAYYGQTRNCLYDTGEPTAGRLSVPVLNLPLVPPHVGSVTLRYCSNRQTEENTLFDTCKVLVDGLTVDEPPRSETWDNHEVDLTQFAGQGVRLEFAFDSRDRLNNNFRGWQVDGLSVEVRGLECTACYADCDGDGTLDFFDFLCFQNRFLAQDPYADCDGDGVLDFFDFLCFQNEFLAGCP